jgi:hypothetical protein
MTPLLLSSLSSALSAPHFSVRWYSITTNIALIYRAVNCNPGIYCMTQPVNRDLYFLISDTTLNPTIFCDDYFLHSHSSVWRDDCHLPNATLTIYRSTLSDGITLYDYFLRSDYPLVQVDVRYQTCRCSSGSSEAEAA